MDGYARRALPASGSGAPRSLVARQFRNTKTGSGSERATCMHCGPEGNVIDESKQSTGIVCRAKRLYMPHLLKCTKIPIKVLKECCHDENIPCPAWLTEALAKEAAGDVAAPPAAKRRGVEALVVRVPQALQERIERKIYSVPTYSVPTRTRRAPRSTGRHSCWYRLPGASSRSTLQAMSRSWPSAC